MKKKLAFLVLFFSFILVINYSLLNITKWTIDNKKNEILEIEMLETSNISEVSDSEATEIIEQDDEISYDNPYWNYIRMNLINVDFTELKKVNSDVVGWIQVNGTNINYPFVQTKDNSYYLNHSIDKSYTDAGWVFLDYRNDMDNLGRNSIIYAHARKNRTMFGSLKNILESDWYNDVNNHVIKLSTPTENTLWQVFSIYRIPTTNDYIQTEFITDYEYENFLNKLKNRSYFKFDTTVNKHDLVLTLSTCYNNNEKVVLHAKLIKKEIRPN